MKRIAVLGSTGSIGRSTLEVIARHPERVSLVGLAAHSRIELLQEQIARYQPEVVAVLDDAAAVRLRRQVGGTTQVLQGVEGLTRVATHPSVDLIVVGTAGPDALLPLVRAIEAGKDIALASKELLVMAGELIMRKVQEHRTRLLPIDSEHAALFQLLQGVAREQVERVILTGSGGSLWSMDAAQQDHVSPEQVLRHPKWKMGPKITVDSATLMNKGLEVIEAHWLFAAPLDRIRVVIHPQAVVHAMVELTDGSCLAQMSPCDMRLPIQAALSFPERWPLDLPRLSWTQLAGLQFFDPDLDRFPCLRLALETARLGGTACGVLSAANEVAVWAFLRETIAFGDIPRVIEDTLAGHAPLAHPTLEEILAADQWARQAAQTVIGEAKRVVQSVM